MTGVYFVGGVISQLLFNSFDKKLRSHRSLTCLGECLASMFLPQVPLEVTALEKGVLANATRERTVFEMYANNMSSYFLFCLERFSAYATTCVSSLFMHSFHVLEEILSQRKVSLANGADEVSDVIVYTLNMSTEVVLSGELCSTRRASWVFLLGFCSLVLFARSSCFFRAFFRCLLEANKA